MAEDNLVSQKLATALLLQRGHRVTVAGNGREALAALTSQALELVLMYVQMPEMGWVEAAAIIRRREESSGDHLAVIALTAHALHGDRERFLEAGMDDYSDQAPGPGPPGLGADPLERWQESIGAGEKRRAGTNPAPLLKLRIAP